MPYVNNAQLPKGVQANLSEAAQDIYRQAYNDAWDAHRYAQDRYDTDDSRQVTASRVAWKTVKDRCERARNGKWIASEEAMQDNPAARPAASQSGMAARA